MLTIKWAALYTASHKKCATLLYLTITITTSTQPATLAPD